MTAITCFMKTVYMGGNPSFHVFRSGDKSQK